MLNSTRPCVIIIDDDVALCDYMADLAEQAGFRSVSEHNASNLQSLLVERPVLIVLDLGMSDVDGVEVMRKLAGFQYGGQVLLISGFDMQILLAAQTLGELQGLRLLGVLSKPFRAKEMLQMLDMLREPQAAICEKQVLHAITLNELLMGMDREEFVMHYQPQVRLSDGAWVGVEALVRWQHPQLGLLMPDAFISLAEKGGIALLLTRKVIGIALSQWAQASLGLEFGGNLSINLSPSAMIDVSFPEEVVAEIAKVGCEHVKINFEVTESSVSPDPTKALDILTRLRIKGFSLSIDDFGTGHSSLENLMCLPFSELKIDKDFVRHADSDPSARAIVKNSIELGHDLGLTVVAEGVESEFLWCLLRDKGCDFAQGYFISRPIPIEQISAWKLDWDARFKNVSHAPLLLPQFSPISGVKHVDNFRDKS